MTQIILSVVMLGLAGLILYMVLTELSNFVMSRVPFVPTRKEDVVDMVERVGITETDIVYDLGSGNGKVVFLIEQLTGAQAMGLQHAGWTQTYAKVRARLIGAKAKFINGNFFNKPWGEATVIYGYLYPPLMSRVGAKALEECQPGTKLVIRDFPISTMQAHAIWATPSNHTMYLYIV